MKRRLERNQVKPTDDEILEALHGDACLRQTTGFLMSNNSVTDYPALRKLFDRKDEVRRQVVSELPPSLNFLVHLRLALSFARDHESEDPLERLEYGITKTIDHHLKLSESRFRRR